MAQQFLHGANVVTGLEQVRGEGMAQHVGRAGFVDAGAARGERDGLLHRLLEEVVAALHAGARVHRALRAGQPQARGAAGYLTASASGSQTAPKPACKSASCSALAWAIWRCRGRTRFSGSTVMRSLLPLPWRTVISRRSNSTSLHAQSQAFEQPHARAVQQRGEQAGNAIHFMEQCADFAGRQHHGQAPLHAG